MHLIFIFGIIYQKNDNILINPKLFLFNFKEINKQKKLLIFQKQTTSKNLTEITKIFYSVRNCEYFILTEKL